MIEVVVSREHHQQAVRWLLENIGPLDNFAPSGEVVGHGWSYRSNIGTNICRFNFDDNVNEEMITLFILRFA